MALDKSYILGSWVNSCLQGFKLTGWCNAEILRHAGLEAHVVNQTYWNADQVTRLFDAAYQLHGNSVGLVSRLGLVPNTFQSLSLAVLAAPNFHTGLHLMAKYSAYISNVLRYTFDDTPEHPLFSYDAVGSAEPHVMISDAILAATVRTFRFVQPRSELIYEVHLAQKKPDDAAVYEAYFGVPIQWQAKQHALLLNRASLLQGSMHANAALFETHDADCLNTIHRLKPDDFLAQLSQSIRTALSDDDFSISAVAERLGVSVRSLQRRLSKQNTSYSQLLDQVRMKEAEVYINSSAYSVSEIAQNLGFSDAGNFTRAFKRWYQCAPQHYRKLVQ
ncbi:AraC family transcriptional regulator [Corallincola holothuriorum]|uniref:AraC family transcriptional regulator n=1 Tax=Corallincola holothuriorum TaxID=2282215 RepID=A0A368NLY5_9GAMM|nr:AraC family transcriptional regulator [Corallincola holothuriorum]